MTELDSPNTVAGRLHEKQSFFSESQKWNEVHVYDYDYCRQNFRQGRRNVAHSREDQGAIVFHNI